MVSARSCDDQQRHPVPHLLARSWLRLALPGAGSLSELPAGWVQSSTGGCSKGHLPDTRPLAGQCPDMSTSTAVRRQQACGWTSGCSRNRPCT